MAAGKKDKDSAAPLKSAFNAPFQGLDKVVRVAPAPSPTSRPSARQRQSQPPGPPRQPPAEAQQAPPPQPSDHEVLSEALRGVAPLAKETPRVFVRRKVDLSSIAAAHRRDIDAMARGEGFDVTFDENYVRGRADGVSFETLGRLERGEFPISAHLDLHGLPLEDARREVDAFLLQQQKKGHRCVLLVTGKGKNSPGQHGVLREQVPQWLARGPSARRVLAFASARPCDGGLGALAVLLRRDSSSKNRIDVERGGVGGIGR